MYDIAEQVARWLADGRSVHIAQIVETRGFSSRDPGATLAWTDDGAHAGALIQGLDVRPDRLGLLDITITDSAATGVGLSCGGTARVLAQDAAEYPPDTWARLGRREPLCVVSEVDGTIRVYGPHDVHSAAQLHADIPRLFARGTSSTTLYEQGDSAFAVITLWPATTLVVVGDGRIADSLADAATLLGWTAEITNDASAAADLAATLTESDAAVVLSHDRAVDVPALAALVTGRAGYVGALGSRGTQSARRRGLSERGIDDDLMSRIHGPAGLDIDAHTPGEIAISIVAEILASRAGSSGGSISARQGPVHTAGVHAPPPRY